MVLCAYFVCVCVCVQGIDSEEPMLQVDNYVFKGRYEDVLGTAMMFQHDKGTDSNTRVFP